MRVDLERAPGRSVRSLALLALLLALAPGAIARRAVVTVVVHAARAAPRPSIVLVLGLVLGGDPNGEVRGARLDIARHGD